MAIVINASSAPYQTPGFLSGGGVMGELMRSYDWERTCLGSPQNWPSTLKTSLRLLLTSNHPMIIWWGSELIQFYNDAYLQTMDAGGRHPRALGQPGRECWEEIWTIIGPQINYVMSGQGATWHEEQLLQVTRHTELHDEWWTYGFSPIEDDAGVHGVLVVCNNVTEQHQAREKLQQLNRQLEEEIEHRKQAEARLALQHQVELNREQERSHNILRTLKDGFMLMDSHFRVLQINAAGLMMSAMSEADVVGRLHWDVWQGSEKLDVGDTYRYVMRERQASTLKGCYELADKKVWLDIYVYPYGDGIAVLFRDITHQVNTEQNLAEVSFESEQRKRFYETFLSHTPDLAYVFDRNHKFIYANAVLLKMWGKTWEEAIGKNCLELGYEPWHAEMHDREIEQVIATKQAVRGDVPFNGTFGRRIYDYIFVPVLGPDGEVEVIAGTTRDVTERKEHEERLQQLADDLAETNRRKTEFLATLAHELRNPLAPIRTGLELMRISQPNAASHSKALEMMGRQLNQLVRLIDDLLEIARINSGKIELKNQRVDFTSIATTAVEAVLGQIESAGHKLEIQICDDTIWLDVDPDRIAQILSNLLTNAIKYTPARGHIILKAQLEGDFATISVIDNGVGIPQDALNQVFDMFSQVSQTKNHSQGGLGIGLSLVRSLVQMHGGTVIAQSDGEGKGSTFTLKLPLAKSLTPATTAIPSQIPGEGFSQNALQILLADDNQDAANTLSSLLSLLGHSVAIAYDGNKALNIATLNYFDLIILDLGMPGLNGYEVAAEIRKIPRLKKTMLAALTGWGSENHRDKTKEAGFDVHLTKPATIIEINQLLSAVTTNSS
ncbi:MAG: ATP-binding protein [Cellvibrio sp.]|uniref:PAS domain-containing hybrid sensor histidine kinase/response regulator n=1 Tax=Cellvibrio sp. TaxID=1965322 RepID=UPI0031B307B2